MCWRRIAWNSLKSAMSRAGLLRQESFMPRRWIGPLAPMPAPRFRVFSMRSSAETKPKLNSLSPATMVSKQPSQA